MTSMYLSTSMSSTLHHALSRQGTGVDGAPAVYSTTQVWAKVMQKHRLPVRVTHIPSVSDLPLSPEGHVKSCSGKPWDLPCWALWEGNQPRCLWSILPWSRDWTTSQSPNQPSWVILFPPWGLRQQKKTMTYQQFAWEMWQPQESNAFKSLNQHKLIPNPSIQPPKSHQGKRHSTISSKTSEPGST